MFSLFFTRVRSKKYFSDNVILANQVVRPSPKPCADACDYNCNQVTNRSNLYSN